MEKYNPLVKGRDFFRWTITVSFKGLRQVGILFLLITMGSCFCESERKGNYSLEGNWYTIYDSLEGFESTDRYQEIYFTKEFYYWNDWYELSSPRKYEIRNDSFFIGGKLFYFKIENYKNDSVNIAYENGKNRWLIRLDTTETPFRGMILIDEEYERIRTNRLDRAFEMMGVD